MMILVMVWVAGGGLVVVTVAGLAPVRERVVTSGTSRMMLEAQMLVMVFSSGLYADSRPPIWRVAEGGVLATGGSEGPGSATSTQGCGDGTQG